MKSPSLADRVRTVPGVIRAFEDPDSGDLWVICDPNREPEPLELAVRRCLPDDGLDHDQPRIRLAFAGSGVRKRIRFLGTERIAGAHDATVTVRLEWNGAPFQASATGDHGEAVELRTTARAAVLALERTCGHSLGLRILGLKRARAFDSELMVASLVRTGEPPRRMVGSVIVSDSPLDSAALAVLSAVNRYLGNFVDTSD